jgi:hypothetical protein
MEQTALFRSNHGTTQVSEQFPEQASQRLRVNFHACKASQRGFQQATDRLRRANRDLGEAAAFLAASLTTITAVEAVINLAVDKLHLEEAFLQLAFDVYIAFLIGTVVLGVLRFAVVLSRRAWAEKEVDQAKQAIYQYCDVGQWPKSEE